MTRYSHPAMRHARAPNRQSLRIIEKLWADAVKSHRAGKLIDAERLYRQVLAIDPRHADSLHLLGMAQYQSGHHNIAVEMIREAIRIKPEQASYYSNLGTVLQAQGKLHEAKKSYNHAVALKPDYAEAYTNLGTVLQAQGDLDQAAANYRAALAIKPDCFEAEVNLSSALHTLNRLDEAASHCEHALTLRQDCAEAWYNMGNIRQAQIRLDDAANHYRRALNLKPQYAEAYGNLGTVLQDLGNLPDALRCYQQALLLKPDYPEVLSNLGNILHLQGQLDDAIAGHQHALSLKPQFPEAHYNLGNVFQSQDKQQEALAHYEQALVLRPAYAEALYNWGCALQALGKLDEALEKYGSAIRVKPDYAQAHFSKSLGQLLGGNFADGWTNYEWRWQTKDHDTKMRAYSQPLWNGEKLSSGRLFIWGEQGIGDEIMFTGLIPDVLRTGTPCVLDCDPRLKPLFARSFPAVHVVSHSAPDRPLEFDFAAHLPGGSLPGFFRRNFAQFAPATSAYLFADSAQREMFRGRYSDGRRVVGLAWFTKNLKTGRNRSIDLSLLNPLFTQPGVRWVSLQYGDHNLLEQQAAEARAPLLIDRDVNQFQDIDRFAAQIVAMDMVVTIDNSTAHLSAALGVPTWLLLPFSPDWRWLQNREDSPWYPAMRLFRQPKLGDWKSVIQSALATLIAL